MGRAEGTAWKAYDRIADSYARAEHLRPDRRRYEIPALRSLIGDVSGRRVLDLCCGSGENAVWLAQNDALVTAMDGSPRMLGNAARKAATQGLRLDLSRLVLPGPVPLADASQDLVVMALALHFFEDWSDLVAEIHRVLRPGGDFVASVCHPADVLFEAGPYLRTYFTPGSYATERYGTEAVVHRRPLESVVAPFLAGGFALTGLAEPRLLPEDDDDALDRRTRRLMHRPKWLCFRMRRIRDEEERQG